MRKTRIASLGLALSAGIAFASSALAQIAGTATGQVAVTPNAAAYSTGQCLGGVLAVPNMLRPGGPGGTTITGLAIVDSTGANAAVDVLIFDTAPAGTYTDHAACTVNAADQDSLAGIIFGANATCAKDAAGTTGICQGTPALQVTSDVFPVTGSSLWAVPIVRGTPTYGGGATLWFTFKAYPD